MQPNNCGWINQAAAKRHAAIIRNRGQEVARIWGYTPEEAQARADKLIRLQRWRFAEVVIHEA